MNEIRCATCDSTVCGQILIVNSVGHMCYTCPTCIRDRIADLERQISEQEQSWTAMKNGVQDRIADLERKVENLTEELAAADSALSTMRPHYERGTS